MSGRTPGLHSETFGCGPDLVMAHGWAMHSEVWREFAEQLAEQVRVTLIDLPGHGRSGNLEDFSLDRVADALAATAPERAFWLGWSLGALLAVGCAARHPGRVRGLLLMAGSPRFVSGPDWPGVASVSLERVALELESDFVLTLRRFIGLQTFGLENARRLGQQIGAALDRCPPPEIEALRGGLDLLRRNDLREALRRAECPSLAVLGAHDRLVPKEVGLALQALVPGLELRVLDAAAHLPFATHPEETAAVVLDFVARHAAR
jgi:pimeloyl-[acyl-carrier protein] methyl ester esterase